MYIPDILENQQEIKEKFNQAIEQQEAQQEKTARDFIKVGDILYTCWGYEQTNTEFFKVIKIIGKRYFLIREVKAEEIKNNGNMSGFFRATNEFIEDKEPLKAYCSKEGYMSVCERGYKRSLYLDNEDKNHYISWYH